MTDFAFRDLPEHAYPFTIRAFDEAGNVVWTETVERPGALYVPPLAQTYGPVTIEVEYPDGSKATA